MIEENKQNDQIIKKNRKGTDDIILLKERFRSDSFNLEFDSQLRKESIDAFDLNYANKRI